MTAAGPALYPAVVGFGVLGALLLGVIAWRAGSRREREWMALARAQGWRCEPAADGDASLVLHGHAHGLAWSCSACTGPAVISAHTATRNITRLETIWRTALPARWAPEDLCIYDARQFAQLRGMAAPALAAVAPGLGGEALRAGLQHARAGETVTLATGHVALTSSATAAQRLASAPWLAALARFAQASGGRPHRIQVAPRGLQIAVLGVPGEREALRAFVDAAVLLAQATLARLQELAEAGADGAR